MPLDPNIMKITATGPSGRYEVDSDTLTAMMDIYLPASLNGLKSIINKRVTGNCEGDAFYRCSAQNVMEALIILADFTNGEGVIPDNTAKGYNFLY